jgi:hypothetical protein
MARRIGRRERCYRCFHAWVVRGRSRPSLCPRCKSRAYRSPRPPSRTTTNRLFERIESLPVPVWDGLGRIRSDPVRRQAKDELLVRSGMRPSTGYGTRRAR